MMPDAKPPVAMSRVTCARCGEVFNCSPRDDCWCAAESFRLPMPALDASTGCLCPTCLRAHALGSRAPTAEP